MDTQLWDKKMEKCIVKSHIKFNSAIIFQTNNISWHSLPEKILCPENKFRKSFAYYYISPLSSKSENNKFGNDGSILEQKLHLLKDQNDRNEKLEKLYKIRPFRRIEDKDMKEI